MKLGTLKTKTSRDGRLVVVSRNNKWAQTSSQVQSLREAVENWSQHQAHLQQIFDKLNSLPPNTDATNRLPLDGNEASAGVATQQSLHKLTFAVDEQHFHSPLPRTFQWADGSAFIHHIVLVRKARGAEPPETLMTVPLMYQGGGDDFQAPYDDIPQIDFAHGTDFEGEVGVIVDDVPMGVSADEALRYIRLFVLINDVSLRGLIPGELKQGFGFFQGKPSTSFAPFAVTPDELGGAWRGGRVHLPLWVDLNGKKFGRADAGAMHFDFGQLIAHAARTRRLRAGAVIGSGTVSNEDPSKGSSCLAEKRMIEKINTGTITTPFMRVGDRVQMQMFAPVEFDSGGRSEAPADGGQAGGTSISAGHSLFGQINQKVVAA